MYIHIYISIIHLHVKTKVKHQQQHASEIFFPNKKNTRELSYKFDDTQYECGWAHSEKLCHVWISHVTHMKES